MSTTDKFTDDKPAEQDKSPDAFAEKTVVQTVDGKRVKGVEGEAPPPDDQPKREDEDLSALLRNPNANQKPN
ncbi:hypothetical protein FXN63_19525 [Pigmentiphaga aceris]|uniref:Uncharacterized protein n=1 Tax=Pigmentiphaga aceris TaxID=1940612 RepID=A0A5C0B4K9_9BURK|nr:hypothetical protein [Pigmentiphaga aceris]QEI07781.1 hypothetical protein FXN63_19525 [Pigmentiphaga aceris]